MGGIEHRVIRPRRAVLLLCALLCVSVAECNELPALTAAARSILGAHQGVYVEAADGSVLVSQAAATPVHPASVSKIATTLALLRKFGCEYRFTTVFAANGAILGGTLEGDLLASSDGDPYFVDENALLVVERLQELGVRRVAGSLRVRGAFTFDWQSDADGSRLRQALTGAVTPAAWKTVRSLHSMDIENSAPAPGGLPPAPGIQFDDGRAATAAVGTVGSAPEQIVGTLPERPLVVHRSQPLLSLVKSLNDYSNNIFKPLAEAAGGAASVEALARSVVPREMRAEIILDDGAGTDERNRLSPRVAVKLLRTLDRELESSAHALFDILPVAGVDEGTLLHRLDGPSEAGRVVGKTGTYSDYGASALIGAIATSDRGTIYFAILNHGVPVLEARRHQDRFVRVLLASLHSIPWRYERDGRSAVARATASVVGK